MKKVDKQSRISRIGVTTVQLAFHKLGFLFREQPIEDYGIDAHIEIVDQEHATGKLIALQIRSGESSFRDIKKQHIVYHATQNDVDYWLSIPLPVLLILYHPKEETIYWQIILDSTVEKTGKSYKILVPLTQQVSQSSVDVISQYAKKLEVPSDYTLFNLEDASHGAAKRYTAKILLNKEFSKPELVHLIGQIIQKLKYRKYQRNKLLRQRVGNSSADYILMFVAYSLEDIQRCNWVCRASWVSEKLDSAYTPQVLSSPEVYPNGIKVEWTSSYKTYADYYSSHTMTKEDFLEQLENLVSSVMPIIEQLFALNEAYFNKHISEEHYVEQMNQLERKLTPLYFKSGDLGYTPFECKDLSQQFQNFMATSHNIVLPFSETGAGIWKKTQRDYMVQTAIRDCYKESLKFQFEYEKIVQ